MTSAKLFEELRDLGSCQKCRDNLEKFPCDGEQRQFALACAAETREFFGCDDCLKLVVDFVREHSQEGKARE